MKTAAGIVENALRTRLSNGLTVIARQDRSVPIVTTMVWYRVGTRYEKPGSTGISHFLEHMMFKGTRRYAKGEIDAITTRHGGANNAFTANDYTAYYFSFASDRWRPALEVEADRIRHSLIDPVEFELEKQVILEELKMELDEPWGALRQAVESLSFRAHPYRFPIIGLQRDIVRMTPRRMLRHYRKHYVPANAVLVLVGDFDNDSALALVEELFGPIPADPAPPMVSFPEEERERQIRVQLRRDGSLDRLMAAFPAPSVRQPEHHTLHVLDKILAEGKLSRLYRRLMDDGSTVSFMSADFADTYDPYLFSIRFELLPGVAPSTVEKALFEELDRLASSPVEVEELARAKKQCMLSFLGSFETTLDQAVQLGLMETLDRFEYWRDYPERIESVSPRDVMEYARQRLTPEKATIGILTHEADQAVPVSG